MSEQLQRLARSFAGRRVVVLGDLVADQFVYGEISRVSREAPVLILRHERTETVPGGAANCAANLASLGARAAIVGTVGDDAAGRALLERLGEMGVDCAGVAVLPGAQTTTKVRLLAGHAHSMRQQVIRMDYEPAAPAGGSAGARIAERLRLACADAEAVVVSDYNYGVAGAEAVEVLRASFVGGGRQPVLVDSRFRLP